MNGRCGSIAWTAPLTPVYVNFLLQLPTVRKMILIPRLRPPTVPALLQGAALSLKRRREEASWRRQTRGRPVIFRLVGHPEVMAQIGSAGITSGLPVMRPESGQDANSVGETAEKARKRSIGGATFL